MQALATIVDYVGFRVFVSCVPPVDEHRTIVYGRLGPSEPFAKHSSMVFSMFKRVARHLNLKTHQAEVLSYSDTAEGEYSRGYSVDAASGVYDEDASYERHNAGDMGNLSQPASTLENQTINLCVPVSVQGHQCDDHRFYATELARLFPSDSPALRSADTLVRILRPELVLKAAYPLSADAYCSSDLGTMCNVLVVVVQQS